MQQCTPQGRLVTLRAMGYRRDDAVALLQEGVLAKASDALLAAAMADNGYDSRKATAHLRRVYR